MDSKGDLFGTTSNGGVYGYGTVFELAKTSGGSYSSSSPYSLVSFNSGDGANPAGNLALDSKGNLFGTTESGGASNRGTIFELPKTAGGSYTSTPTTFVSFNGTDGAYPLGSLVMDTKGNLFGITEGSGSYGLGTIFELPNSGGSYPSSPTTLAPFIGTNDAYPNGGLVIDSKGNLFGTTYGASGQGTVFELPNIGGSYASSPSTLVPYYIGGWHPDALALDSKGNIFSTTELASDNGTLFELAKTTGGNYPSTPTTLLYFSGTDGSNPDGIILDSKGNIFGTTSGGGPSSHGTLFQLAKTTGGNYPSTPTTLVSFNGTDGQNPNGGLVIDGKGNFLGPTEYGGANNSGTVFEVNREFALNPLALPNATVDNYYSQTIAPANGTGPYTYSVIAGALPSWLTLNPATGQLSGTPTSTSGTPFSFTIQATDSLSATGSQPYTLTVNPAITLGPPSLSSGTFGSSYSQQFSAGGGSGSGYTFSTTSALDGLTLSSAGLLSGNPTAAGSFPITITATDSNNATGSQNYTLEVLPTVSLSEAGSPFLENGGTATVTATLNGTSNQDVTIPLTFGGSASASDYSASATSITILAGQPTGSITLTGANNAGFGSTIQTVAVSLGTLTNGTPGSPTSVTASVEPAITLAPSVLPTGTLGNPYGLQFVASGGAGGSFTFSTGSGLDGLTLSSSGLLSGNPAASGSFPVTVTATDSNNASGSASYTLNVNPAIAFSPTILTGTLGVSFSQQLNASGGSGSGYSFAVTAGSLPSGLTLTSGGLLSGTPVPADIGTSNFTVTATDGNKGTGSAGVSFTAASPLGTSPRAIYMESVYGLLLHRAPDSTAAFWVNLLNQGVPASTVVADIEQSPGYLGDVVTALYQHYLKRAPDSGGLSYWTSLLAGGIPIEQVTAGFVTSPEFIQNEAGKGNTAYVTALYGYVLNRSPDTGGYTYWLNLLNGGASPTAVASGFLSSPEYRTDLLAGQPWAPAYSPITNWGGYYPEFLRRSPESSGLASWLAAFQAGISDQQVLAGILGSAEGYGDWS